MRKKILAFVFAAALLVAMAVPLFSGGGTAFAGHDRGQGKSQDENVTVCHKGRIIHVSGDAVSAHVAHGDTGLLCPPTQG